MSNRKCQTVLRQLLSDIAIRHDRFGGRRRSDREEPSRLVKKPKDRQKKMRVLSAAGAQAVIDAARGTRNEALYLMAINTGMRRGELLALRWSDIDLKPDGGEVLIERAVSTYSVGERYGPPKNDEARTVEIGPDMIAALKRQKAMIASEQLVLREWADARLVFPNQRGAVQRSTSLVRDLERALAAAGLPRIRFHDLRHTAATLMLRSGTPVVVVGKILRYKDPAITLRRYAHVLLDMQTDAAAKMDVLLS